MREIIYIVLPMLLMIFIIAMTYVVDRRTKEPIEPTQEPEMDKKIKKVISKEKAAVKETKELLKMDKKHDKKLEKLKIVKKKKK